jgi:lysophospholipid acyltransferase (LPLAT)-like uncharacterized protein
VTPSRRATLAVGPAVAALGVRALAHTLRLTRDRGTVDGLLAAGTPVIFVSWHGRILLLPWLYASLRARVLASRSRDGEFLARVIERFGFETIRGSSSRGGTGALRAMVGALRQGQNVVVAPDGPRGPREQVKPGIAALARLSGAPVVPMAVGASPEWQLGSWDGFRIPKPFARCVARMGAAIPAPTDREHDEAARAAIERALVELSARVDAEARR